MSADFTFTSPQDEQIDRHAFFERCFPTADRFSTQELLHVVEDGDDVLLTYEYVLAATGERYRNAEVLSFRGGALVAVQVFFGGRYPG